MPALVAKQQEKATVTKLKKYYSVISQAYAMAQQEYGDPTGWDLIANDNLQGAQNMADKFRPYLKVVKEDFEPNGYRLDLVDGTSVRFVVRSPNCSSVRGTGNFAHTCGLVELDLRKTKLEEELNHGANYFQFVLSKMSVLPSGLPDDTARSFDKNCPTSTGIGYGCVAWVIYKENMDYLHCRDQLSWGGKTKCD
jgi:hypothetical protein